MCMKNENVSRSVMSDSEIPWTVAHWAPLSVEFSRQEHCSGLPFPSPGDLPDPGIEPRSPALQADALPSELSGKPIPGGSDVKEPACNSGDLGSIPGLGRSPGEEKGYPFQYSGCENSIDYIVAKPMGLHRVGHD